jgi:hypothetical protein
MDMLCWGKEGERFFSMLVLFVCVCLVWCVPGGDVHYVDYAIANGVCGFVDLLLLSHKTQLLADQNQVPDWSVVQD